MKWLAWIAGALVAVLVLTGVALLWALPRLAKSEAARARIESAAKGALGRDLQYGELDFALLPPSLVVDHPTVAGERAGDPPLASAERVALHVALWPLLRRELEVTSLAIDEVLREHAADVARVRAGEEKVLHFLIGQVMRRTRGKANPQAVRELLAARIATP